MTTVGYAEKLQKDLNEFLIAELKVDVIFSSSAVKIN